MVVKNMSKNETKKNCITCEHYLSYKCLECEHCFKNQKIDELICVDQEGNPIHLDVSIKKKDVSDFRIYFTDSI